MQVQERSDDLLKPLLNLLECLHAAVLLEVLLYGVHLVLFCVCVNILAKRRNFAQPIILVALAIMFALATADISLSFRLVVKDIPSAIKGSMPVLDVLTHMYPKNPLFVTNNLIADGLLLYRCYVVWHGRKYVILGPVILLVADTVWGYVGAGTNIFSLQKRFIPVYLWTVFAMNTIMTILTAGRIWWVARTNGEILGKRRYQPYYTAIAVLIESGAIYSISVLFLLVMPPRPYRLIFSTMILRIVGIMPTLIIVQVELSKRGHGVEGESIILSTVPPRISFEPEIPAPNVSFGSGGSTPSIAKSPGTEFANLQPGVVHVTV